ncbi:hypothetical protein C0992_011783, partial [Termitomyces sp. T32_za158]
MHLKNLVLLVSGVATITSASVIDVEKLLDPAYNTFIAPAEKFTGKTFKMVQNVIQPRLECTGEERWQINRLKYEVNKLRRQDFISISDQAELYGEEMSLDAAPEKQPRIPFQGDPATCKELQHVTETYQVLK